MPSTPSTPSIPSLSAAEALNLLKSDPSKYSTPDSLRALANQVSAFSEGKVTVLFSGPNGSGFGGGQIAQSMWQQGDDVRAISRTEAHKFLENARFIEAVAKAFGVPEAYITEWAYKDQPANKFFNEAGKGLWGELSVRFAFEASGDVRIIAPFSDPTRILAIDEMPSLLKDAAVKSINGIPKSVFQAIYDKTGSLAEVNKAVALSSYKMLQELGLSVKPELGIDGKPNGNYTLEKVNSAKFLEGAGVSGTTLPAADVTVSLKTAMEGMLTTESAGTLSEGSKLLLDGYAEVHKSAGTVDISRHGNPTAIDILRSYVDLWRKSNGIAGNDPLTPAQTEQFARELKAQVEKFPITAERVSWGSYAEGTPSTWNKDARLIVADGNLAGHSTTDMVRGLNSKATGEFFGMADTAAGQVVINEALRESVAKQIGGNASAASEAYGKAQSKAIFDGQVNLANERISGYGIGDVLSLKDTVSGKLTLANAKGNLIIFSQGSRPGSVLSETNIAEIFKSTTVTAINDVPIEVFKEILKQTGSITDVAKAIDASSLKLLEEIKIGVVTDGAGHDRLVLDAAKFTEGTSIGEVLLPDNAKDLHLVKEDLVKSSTPENLARYQEGKTILQHGLDAYAKTLPGGGGPSDPTDFKGLMDFVESWRARNGISGNNPLTKAQTEKFAADVASQVEKFSVKPERVTWAKYPPGTPTSWSANARGIFYQGALGGTGIWQYARGASQGAHGELFYISDTPAGQLLNSSELKKAMGKQIGGTGSVDNEAYGKKVTDLIFDGQFDDNYNRTSRYGVGDQLALNDVVSRKLAITHANGDVLIFSQDVKANTVLTDTELVEILKSSAVKSINGVPIEVFHEILKNGSMSDVAKAIGTSSRDMLESVKVGVITDADGSKTITLETTKFTEGTPAEKILLPDSAIDVRLLKEDLAKSSTPENLARYQEGKTILQHGLDVYAKSVPGGGGPSHPTDFKGLMDFVESWRARNGISGNNPLTKAQTEKFAADVASQVEKFSVKPERVTWAKYPPGTPTSWSANARGIFYQGALGGTGIWQYARGASQGAHGELFYISDTPAGQLLNSSELKKAMGKQIGGTGSVDNEAYGKKVTDLIFDGQFDDNYNRTSRYGVGDQLALNDVVSRKLAITHANGDVLIFSQDVKANTVLTDTELVEILKSSAVKSINGVPIEVFHEILKNGSMSDVAKAIGTSSRDMLESVKVGVITDADGSKTITLETTKFTEGTPAEKILLPDSAIDVRLLKEDLAKSSTPENLARYEEGKTILKKGIDAYEKVNGTTDSKLTEILDFVKDWRKANNIVGNEALTDAQTEKFARDFIAESGKFSDKPSRVSWGDYADGTPQSWSNEAKPVLGKGKVAGIDFVDFVNGMNRGAKGDFFTLKDTPLGQLTENATVKSEITKAIGGTATAEGQNYGKQQAENIFDGKLDANGSRGPNGVGDVVSLKNFASRNFIMHNGSGNLITLSQDGKLGGPLTNTQVADILKTPGIKTINHMPIEVFNNILERTGSFTEVSRAIDTTARLVADNVRVGEFMGSDGVSRVAVDTTNFRTKDAVGSRIPEGASNIRSLGEDFARVSTTEFNSRMVVGSNELGKSIAEVELVRGRISTPAMIGIGILTLPFLIKDVINLAESAKKQTEAGNPEAALAILKEGAAVLATSLVIGTIATGLVIAALHLHPATWIIEAGAVIIGTYAGFVVGEEAGSLVASLFDKSKDIVYKEVDGWNVITLPNGTTFASANPGTPFKDFNSQILTRDASGAYTQLQKNTVSGDSAKIEWSGAPGDSQIKSKETTKTEENGSITTASITYDKGEAKAVFETNKSPIDGTVLSTKTTTFELGGRIRITTDDQHGTTVTTDRFENGAYASQQTNPDGSTTKSTGDADGNASIKTVSASGQPLYEFNKSWDGTITETVHKPDGTDITRKKEKDGTQTTLIDDPQGNKQSVTTNADGVQISSWWSNKDGSFGDSKLNPDGTTTARAEDKDGNKITTTLVDGTVPIGRIIQKADGTIITETIKTGDMVEGKIQKTDGSYVLYTADGPNQTAVSYNAGGLKTGENWSNPDGSNGTIVYNFDGSSSGVIKNSDGTSLRFTSDGQGNVVTKDFNVKGQETATRWSSSDGSHGYEDVGADGKKTGETFDGKGNHSVFSRSENGNFNITGYDKDGRLVSTNWKDGNANGTSYRDKDTGSWVEKSKDGRGGEIENEYKSNGVVRKSETFGQDGSVRSSLDDGQGTRIETVYGPDGVGIVSNTTTSYNPDGSGTIRTTDAEGRSTEKSYGPGSLGPTKEPKKPDYVQPTTPGKGTPKSQKMPQICNPAELGPDGKPVTKINPRALDNAKGSRDAAQDIFNKVSSPLILDLNSNGLETIPLSQGTRFDHDNNKFGERTGWVGPNDGLLVLDRNQSGQIEGGAELFGNHTFLADGTLAANGFVALAEFDSNHDGQIDKNDAVFSQLQVWRDANSNAKVDIGELLSLAEAGVASIATAYENSKKIDSQFNHHRQIGQFTRTDGSWAQMHDVWFAINPDDVEVPRYKREIPNVKAQSLPEMDGFGAFRNLRDAMTADSALAALVQQFVDETSDQKRFDLADKILKKWSGADKLDLPITNYDSAKMYVLGIASGEENPQFNGTDRFRAGALAKPYIDSGYESLQYQVYYILARQASLPLLETIGFTLAEDGTPTWTIEKYEEKKKANPKAALADLVRLYQHYAAILSDFGIDVTSKLKQEIAAYGDNPEIKTFLASIHLLTDPQQLDLYGPSSLVSDLVLWRPDGSRVYYGSYFADVMQGESGDDTFAMTGGDTVKFGLGDGRDTIHGRGGNNIIKFQYDIAPQDVTASLVVTNGDAGSVDLVLKLKSGESLTIVNWYQSADFGRELVKAEFSVSSFQFKDGTVWHANDVYRRVQGESEEADLQIGFNSDDVIRGGSGNDQLWGWGGNDVVLGGYGDDTVNGGTGSDIVLGGAGNDLVVDQRGHGANLLDGGAGNDILRGGAGSNSYFFDRGYGQDQIWQDDQFESAQNVLIFGAGIQPTDLIITRDAVAAVFSLKDSADQLRVEGWFSQNKNTMQYIQFSDGTRWATPELEKHLSILTSEHSDITDGTQFADTIDGLAGNDKLNGYAGDDVLLGGEGNDFLLGAEGNDKLEGGAGNDTMDGGDGNDTLRGSIGNDHMQGWRGKNTYLFERGDGTDVIGGTIAHHDSKDLQTIVLNYSAAEVSVALGGNAQGSIFIRRNDSADSIEIENRLTSAGGDPLRIEFSDGTVWDGDTLRAMVQSSVTSGNDYIYGSKNAEILAGGNGDDTINGFAGNDTLDGGAGNDRLDGGSGDDSYLFGYGSGQDLIIETFESPTSNGSFDTIRLAAGIRPEDVVLSTEGYYRVLRLVGSDDQLKFQLDKESTRIERLEFADGTVWKLNDNPNEVPLEITKPFPNSSLSYYAVHGTLLNDVLVADNVHGTLLEDKLGGDDTLLGGNQAEVLISTSGKDVFKGGGGWDQLTVGDEARILFARGDSRDTVKRTPNSKQTIVFDKSIKADDLEIFTDKRRGLFVTVKNTRDSIYVVQWFDLNDKNNAATFEFADGSKWDVDQIRSQISTNLPDPEAKEYLDFAFPEPDNRNLDDLRLYGTQATEAWVGGIGSDLIEDMVGDDTMSGGAGNDYLNAVANKGNNLLVGGAGNDTLDAGEGDNTLEGGSGNDRLTAAGGSDTYLFERGFGQDTIIESRAPAVNGARNRIVFGAGITARDIIVTGDNQYTQGSMKNLYLSLFGTKDAVTVQGWFEERNSNIDTVEFADGTVWTRADLLASFYALERGGRMMGTDLNDKVIGDGTDDEIDGLDGNDTIEGAGGSDQLLGGAGNDVLIGGTGDDGLFGSIGDDTYVFEKGFGTDRIADFDRVHGGNDKIVFGAGIAAQDVQIKRQGDDIVLSFAGSTDVLNIRWYENPGLTIEHVQFADGTRWDASFLQRRASESIAITGTVDNDNLFGTSGHDLLIADDGNDQISGQLGDDTIEAGDGNDTLLGGGGSDLLQGDAGNDLLDGGSAGDNMQGGAGDDTYLLDNGEDEVKELAHEGLDLVVSQIDYSLGAHLENLTLQGDKAKVGRGNLLDNVLQGNDAGVTLSGGDGNDSLQGGTAADTLQGDKGNDVLRGGVGDDRLDGGAGADVYLYTRGDGNDTISASDNDEASIDILRFDASIKPQDITLSATPDDGIEETHESTVYLTFNGSNERITLHEWLRHPGSRVARIEFADGTVWDAAYIETTVTPPAVPIIGSDDNDALYGLERSELLQGKAGDDEIYGNNGDDTLQGGTGNDFLVGGTGSDTYLFARGDGQDTIQDQDSNAEAVDVLKFNDSVLKGDIKLTRQGSDLTLNIGANGDRVALRDWFITANNNLERVEFADGTSWNNADLREKFKLDSSALANTTGTAQNDELVGSTAGDLLRGLAGDDTLTAGDGDDVLEGGHGNDNLNGDMGNDVYVFNRGDGQDWINEYDETAGNVDTLRFGASILPQNIKFKRDVSGLTIIIAGTDDSVYLNNWFASTAEQLENIEFADGTVWTRQDVLALLPAPSDADDGIVGTGEGEALDGLGGNDQIFGQGGDDSIVGGTGDDYIQAGEGNDLIDGGAGEDQLEGQSGQDTYIFGKGSGHDFISDGVDGNGPPDIIRIKGVKPSEITVGRDADTLYLSINGSDDRLAINAWYIDNSFKAKQVQFDDGTVWNTAEIESQIVQNHSSEGSDVMFGGDADDVFHAKAGRDRLVGGAGNDVLDGGEGGDDIQGGEGRDILLGASGDDNLFDIDGTSLLDAGSGNDDIDAENGNSIVIGGAGNDRTYVGNGNFVLLFNRADGVDLVTLSDANAVLSLGFALADVGLRREAGSKDLIITAGDKDQLRLVDWYVNPQKNLTLQLIQEGKVSAYALNPVIAVFDQVYSQQNKPTLDWVAENALTKHRLAGELDAAFGGDLAYQYAVAGNLSVFTPAQIKEMLDSPDFGSARTKVQTSGAHQNHAPVVVLEPEAQQTEEGKAFSFVLPENNFSDADAGDTLTLKATLADGSSLPDWLKFDAQTRSFSGTPNSPDIGVIEVSVTATDSAKASVSLSFDLTVKRAPDQQLTGTSAADKLQGLSGNDSLQGMANNDRLTGGFGNDTLDGGTGADTLIGGANDDSYVVDNAGDVVTELSNEGNDVVRSSISYTLAANVEALTLAGTASINGTGNALDNTIIGNAGNNTLDGAAGNDIVQGNSGNDVLNGGSGIDTLMGGLGNDTYVVDNADDQTTEMAGEGTDLVQAAVSWKLGENLENLTLTGNATIDALGNNLNNTLLGNSAENLLQGFAGNDVLNGGAGADTLQGGIGNDTYIVENTQDQVFENVAEGTDLVQASVSYTLTTNVENLTLTGTEGITGIGNEFNNTLIGNVGDNILQGGAGNDVLKGLAGADTLVGGIGNDTYVVDNKSDAIAELFGEGTDLVQSSLSWALGENLENLTLLGNEAIEGSGNELNNVLTGNAAANQLFGALGNDTLNGGLGTDTLVGGLGNDTYVVDVETDMIVEADSEGTDLVQASGSYKLAANLENLTLTGAATIDGTGNEMNNVLTGNATANTLYGAGGNDTLNGGVGADTLIGGAGDDVYQVENVADIIVENADEGIEQINASVSYTLSANLEKLTLTGSAALDGTGNDSNNLITGNAAVNNLFGWAGNDTLSGGAGADVLSGGEGDDTFIVDNLADQVLENADEGYDQVRSSVNNTLSDNVDALLLTGNAAINAIGNIGDNLLQGNAGNNMMEGGLGNDILQGAAGADRLVDTAGNNVLDGGIGNDVLIGGAGHVFFAGGAGNDTITAGGGANVIAFNHGDGSDVLIAAAGQNNTLSLGKGIQYAELLFKKSGNDLILATGKNEQLNLKDWYVDGSHHSVSNLQLILDGSPDYDPNSSDQLHNKKVTQFNFEGLASAFDQARKVTPNLNSWALSSSLTNFYLNSSDSQAIGGDLAFEYGKNGNLSNLSLNNAQNTLADSQFGSGNQNVQRSSAATVVTPKLL